MCRYVTSLVTLRKHSFPIKTNTKRTNTIILSCRHGPSGMCDQCTPLEPYDAKYLEENKIKHMSFHAYLRRACDQNKTAPVTSSAFIAPLDEPSFKVVEPCPSRTHGPYPQGICTKCQPSAVTLTGQVHLIFQYIFA